MIDVFQRKGAKYIYELIMFLRREKTSSLFVLKIFDFLASYFLSIFYRISVFSHNPVILAIISLSKSLSPKYLRFSL